METVPQYLLSVTGTALICSVINTLVGKESKYGAIIRLICSAFLTFTVILPLTTLEIFDFAILKDNITIKSDTITEEGNEWAQSEMLRIIKQETETYILDKARELRMEIEVDVNLSEGSPPVPIGITIRGDASPYAKKQMTEYLARELAIAEEDQIWM